MAGFLCALAGQVPAGLVDAVGDEARDLVALGRRLAPRGGLRLTRRHAGILALALLALVALSGVAGAAEPDPGTRSALEAWTASPLPSTAAAPAAVGGAVAPVASIAPAGLPAGALGADAAFSGPNPVGLVAKGLLVVALLFITLRVLRRVQGAGGTARAGALNVLETRTIGPKTQLHLVAVGNRRLVIGQTPSGLVALGELDAAELAPADADAGEAPAEAEAQVRSQAETHAHAHAPAPALVPVHATVPARLAGHGGHPRRGARFDRVLATADREPAARIMERILEAAADAPADARAGRVGERPIARDAAGASLAGSRPVVRGRLEVSA